MKTQKYMLMKWVQPSYAKDGDYPFKDQEIVLFLGEIKQMPGHCIVVKRNGNILWGLHTDNFVVPSDNEV